MVVEIVSEILFIHALKKKSKIQDCVYTEIVFSILSTHVSSAPQENIDMAELFLFEKGIDN